MLRSTFLSTKPVFFGSYIYYIYIYVLNMCTKNMIFLSHIHAHTHTHTLTHSHSHTHTHTHTHTYTHTHTHHPYINRAYANYNHICAMILSNTHNDQRCCLRTYKQKYTFRIHTFSHTYKNKYDVTLIAIFITNII